MTRILLIRHAAHDWLEKELVGRKENIPISALGREQGQALAVSLGEMPVGALYSSPVLRAWETAEILGVRWKLSPISDEAFEEIDFGKWTGRSFSELKNDPAWDEWNAHRAEGQTPGGESMQAVQDRAVAGVERIFQDHAGAWTAVMSHGDVLKAIIAKYRGLSLDELQTFNLEPASATLLVRDGEKTEVRPV